MEKPTISKNNFKQLLKLPTSGIQFSFIAQIYSQYDGIAMGSTIINIFMSFIEAKIILSFKYKLCYFGYVENKIYGGKIN